MAYKCNSYPVIEKTAISAGIYSYTILCPEVVELASSGQFVHVRVEHFTLRRPISICEIDKRRGTLRIVFEIRGEGTKKLSDINVGDNIDMIAPLGHGFTLPDEIPENKRLLVVGGGIGVPPLLDIARNHKESVTAILGFRSYDKVILANDFKSYGSNVICCTDDGSVGVKGNVCLPLEEELKKGDIYMVYACGPEPMLKGVIEKTQHFNVKCEVSLEQRMGCGVGACVVCTCKITRRNRDFMLRVCKDGPVFKAEEVAF
jgi:dihydroorotate dehydrogenase electron transfer subunit